MTERIEHIKFRKITFNCPLMRPILSDKEYHLLCKYGTWMEALYLKKIKPINDKQKEFCRLVELENPPEEQFANILNEKK